MFSDYKNISTYHKILDKLQRRNKGNIFLLIKNFYYYFKLKFLFKNKFKRNYLIFQIKKNSTIAEVGVWKGDFSKKILDITKPKKLILVDSWTFDNKIRGCAPQVNGMDPLDQNYFNQAYEETILKFKDSNIVDIYKKNSENASKLFDDNFFDYIYIDAEHSYKAVKKDLLLWYPKLKKNGYIFGDDYYWRENDYSFSVEKAYQEFFKMKNIRYWCVFKSQVMFKK